MIISRKNNNDAYNDINNYSNGDDYKDTDNNKDNSNNSGNEKKKEMKNHNEILSFWYKWYHPARNPEPLNPLWRWICRITKGDNVRDHKILLLIHPYHPLIN